MGRNIDAVIKALPQERQKRIRENAGQLAAEMIRHADSLDQLRKAVGKTQTEVAEILGIKQHAVSQLESRADLYVSTLNKYVRALGHKLELILVTASGERVELPNFHPWEKAEGFEPQAQPKRMGRTRATRSRSEPKSASRKGEAKAASSTRQRASASAGKTSSS